MAEPTNEYHPYKMHITLPGGGSFHVEGPEEKVRADYRDFLAALRTPVPVAVAVPVPAPPGAPTLAPAAGQPLPREHLSRVFALDQDGVPVSLLHKPKTEAQNADALLMILWGFRELKNTEQVTAFELMKAARKSGVQLERLDRVIGKSPYVTIGGAKSGTR